MAFNPRWVKWGLARGGMDQSGGEIIRRAENGNWVLSRLSADAPGLMGGAAFTSAPRRSESQPQWLRPRRKFRPLMKALYKTF